MTATGRRVQRGPPGDGRHQRTKRTSAGWRETPTASSASAPVQHRVSLSSRRCGGLRAQAPAGLGERRLGRPIIRGRAARRVCVDLAILIDPVSEDRRLRLAAVLRRDGRHRAAGQPARAPPLDFGRGPGGAAPAALFSVPKRLSARSAQAGRAETGARVLHHADRSDDPAGEAGPASASCRAGRRSARWPAAPSPLSITRRTMRRQWVAATLAAQPDPLPRGLHRSRRERAFPARSGIRKSA